MRKDNRLQRNRDFQRVYRSGRAFSCTHLVVIAMRTRPQVKRLGFSVSRKIGNSVVRNRVKRRLREVFRALLPRVRPGFCYVIVARSSAVEASFESLRRDAQRALDKGNLLTPVDEDQGIVK